MHSQAARRVFSKVMHCMLHSCPLPLVCSRYAGACPRCDLDLEPSRPCRRHVKAVLRPWA